MDQALIENITEIANSEALIKLVEPNLMWHEDVKPNQTKRVLVAFRVFLEECEKEDSEGFNSL